MNNHFFKLEKEEQKHIIEVLIFSSEEPISIEKIVDFIENNFNNAIIEIGNNQNFDLKIENLDEYVQSLIEEIKEDLLKTQRPYNIYEVAGGYTFATLPEYGKILSLLPSFKNKKRLSKAMLETLAIIAYQQPITKPEIEEIRGTNSIEIVNSLLEKGLIQVVGRKDSPGRPFQFGTTVEFLKLFGLNSLQELPNLMEIKSFIEEKTKTEDVTLKIDFEVKNNNEMDSNSTL